MAFPNFVHPLQIIFEKYIIEKLYVNEYLLLGGEESLEYLRVSFFFIIENRRLRTI